MKKRFPIAGAEHIMGATIEREPYHYRVRRCEGNKAAWCLIRLNARGEEINSFGGYVTALSLDSLLANAGHLKPLPGDTVESIP